MTVLRSRDNPQFKSLHKLAGKASERRRSGLTLIEGLHLILAWQASGRPLQKVVTSVTGAGREENAAWLLANRHVPCLCLSDALYAELSVLDTPPGILGVVDVPVCDLAPCADLDCVILDGIQDPGNVGVLLRTAAAAGIRQALLTSDCAQAWSPKTLRAGMGAHFALQVFENVDAIAFLRSYRGRIAITCLEGAASVYSVDLKAPLAWVFGREGEGVRAALAATSNLRVRIPMPGQIESLNVAAAAAVCFFEMVRQRGG